MSDKHLNPSAIHMPSGSSVWNSGWDGLLVTEQYNPWVPQGQSAWEFSCSKSPKQKANTDYEKRTSDPLSLDINDATFIFVTARRWTGKELWSQKCNKSSPWREVRVMDADDLVTWLEQDQETTQWFANLLGKQNNGTDLLLAMRNQLGQLPTETAKQTVNHLDARFDHLEQIFISARDANAGNLNPNEHTSSPEREYDELTFEIDSSVELINQGLIRTAHVKLQGLYTKLDTLPNELAFRIIANLGMCALANQDTVEACAFFNSAHELQPEDPTGLAYAALAAHLENNPARALELATKARDTNPCHPKATSVLIEALWETGDTDRLDDIVQSEAWILQDSQCLLSLAGVREKQSRIDEAVSLYRTLIATDPDDATAYLVLGRCLFNKAQVNCTPLGLTHNQIASLREAEEALTKSFALLQDQQLDVLRQSALLIRATSLTLLGATQEALRDFDAVLAESPHHAEASFQKGLLLLHDGQAEEARKLFEQIDDPERQTQIAIPLAAALVESNDPEQAAKLLRDTIVLHQPDWGDIHRAQILIQAEAALGEVDTIGTKLDKALKQQPDHPKLLVLAAVYHKARSSNRTEQYLLRALELTHENDRTMIQAQLAIYYQDLERFSDAADMFAQVVNDSPAHPAATSLLICFFNARRFTEALSWSGRIRRARALSHKAVIDIEVQILEWAGDILPAVSLLEELCSRSDVEPRDRIRLAAAQLRSSRPDLAKKTLKGIDCVDFNDDPISILRMAQIKVLLDIEGFLNDAYWARRYGMNDPEMHLGYIQLFMKCDDNLPKPDAIGPGCVVRLKNATQDRWWHILKHGETARNNHELPVNHRLAQRLMGHRVGDSIQLRQGLEELTYEVAEVQNQYVRAFQESVSEFSTRFPDHQGWSLIEGDIHELSQKIMFTVDQREQLVSEAERMYRQDRMPFSSFASSLGCSTIELWHGVVESNPSHIRIRSGSGSVLDV